MRLCKAVRKHEFHCQLLGCQLGMTYTGHGKVTEHTAFLRDYFRYTVVLPGGVIFTGDDFSPSPLHCWDSKESWASLVSWFTVQPGDTDAEFFAKYTPEQLAWANSSACEELAWRVQDYEDKLDKRSKRHDC